MGWSAINGMPNVSGGFGLFDRSVAIAAGGYDAPSFAEDIRHTIDSGPSHLTNQIRAHIFQILEKWNRCTGSSNVYDLSVFHDASVSHQHRSADCNYLFF